VIYQLCVAPGEQRKLVGAALMRAVFERSAYGCKLYCCWCAQDIEANRFWESLGFVPIAFRAGSRAKDRVHIFWQRRIRDGRRGYDDAVLVPRADERRGDPRGSAGAADPAGEEMVG
jgi:ribosomal protein S18 acetylase RimI-like enzyme